MTGLTFTLFRDARAELAESPVWDPRTGEVAWVDITAQRITRSPSLGAVNGADDRFFTLPSDTSAVGLTTVPGEFVVALRDGVYRADAQGALHAVARVEHAKPAVQRLNDGKPDPFGNFVVGALDFDGEPRGRLYRVDPDGDLTVLRDGLVNPNGLGWSADGRTFYFADSRTHRLYAADYDDSGLSGERVFANRLEGMPDGLTVDAENHVWLVVLGVGKLVRLAPDGTRVLTLDVPSEITTSVEFAGDDLRTLVLTTTRHRLSGPDAASAPGIGGLYQARTTYTGLPARHFGRPQEDQR